MQHKHIYTNMDLINFIRHTYIQIIAEKITPKLTLVINTRQKRLPFAKCYVHN